MRGVRLAALRGGFGHDTPDQLPNGICRPVPVAGPAGASARRAAGIEDGRLRGQPGSSERRPRPPTTGGRTSFSAAGPSAASSALARAGRCYCGNAAAGPVPAQPGQHLQEPRALEADRFPLPGKVRSLQSESRQGGAGSRERRTARCPPLSVIRYHLISTRSVASRPELPSAPSERAPSRLRRAAAPPSSRTPIR